MSTRDQARISLTLLGGFQARLRPSVPLNFPTRKAQALVAYLALKPGAHPREKLATLLWGDTTEDRARNSLRQTVFALRRVFAPPVPPCLLSESETLSLDPGEVEVDVLAFERIAGNATPAGLTQAAALYGGDLLDGLNVREAPFEEWLSGERERLRELALDSFAKLLSLQAKGGATEAAIQTAVRLLALDPLQESVHRALMRLYVQLGRRGAALKQYRACVDILQRELGVEVEPATRRLYDLILEARRADLGPIEPLTARRTRTIRNPEGVSILVVEDDVVTRTVVEKYLAGAGYRVVAANDGSDALLHLGRRAFDVVVSDIQMPMLDGLKLLETMSERGIETPAIFLTAQPGDELEVKGLRLGAADYLRKPVQKDVLLLRVRNVLSRT